MQPVFTSTPQKILKSKLVIDEFQNVGIVGRKNAKTLAKIQVGAIFHMRDIQRNVGVHLGKPTWRPETNINISDLVLQTFRY